MGLLFTCLTVLWSGAKLLRRHTDENPKAHHTTFL